MQREQFNKEWQQIKDQADDVQGLGPDAMEVASNFLQEQFNNLVNGFINDNNQATEQNKQEAQRLQDEFAKQLQSLTSLNNNNERSNQFNLSFNQLENSVTNLFNNVGLTIAEAPKPSPGAEQSQENQQTQINVSNPANPNPDPSKSWSWTSDRFPDTTFTSDDGPLTDDQQQRVESIVQKAQNQTNNDFVQQNPDIYKLDDKQNVVQKDGSPLSTQQQADYKEFYGNNINANLQTHAAADQNEHNGNGFTITSSLANQPEATQQKSQQQQQEQEQQNNQTPSPGMRP